MPSHNLAGRFSMAEGRGLPQTSKKNASALGFSSIRDVLRTTRMELLQELGQKMSVKGHFSHGF
jgi:hypothetical protein